MANEIENVKPKWRRRKYVNNRDFQFKTVAYFCGLAVINIAVFYGTFQNFFHVFEHNIQAAGLPPNHELFQALDSQRQAVKVVFILISTFMTIMLVGGGIFLSHKVAGPIFRLQEKLYDLCQNGKPDPIVVRKRDFFQDLFIDFNYFLTKDEKWKRE